jgi:hypothetical protein
LAAAARRTGRKSKSEIRNPKSEIRNPKSEIRNPKSEGNPKPEIRNPHPVAHSVRSLRGKEEPVASVLGAGPMPEGLAISPFGFRISDFGFPSDFGLRISVLGLRPSVWALDILIPMLWVVDDADTARVYPFVSFCWNRCFSALVLVPGGHL